MERWGYFLVAIFLGLSAPAQAEGNKLYLYTWDTYVAPELFKKFQQETGIEVITDVYSSNDTLLAKLKAGGAYDIIAPSGNFVSVMISGKLLQPLPTEVRSIASALDDTVKRPEYDLDHEFVMPLFYGTTGLAVNPKLTQENVTSWNQFFHRPDGEKPSLGVLDDVSTVMDVAGIALRMGGCDQRPIAFSTIQDLLDKQKPFVKVYGATGYSERLAANEIAMQMAWSGDIYRVRKQNADIKYIYPKEGVELWVDNLAIPAGAKNVEAAKKFITFIMKPENLAAYSVVSGNIPSIYAAREFLPEDLKKAPEFNIPPGTLTFLAKACNAKTITAYNKIWETLLQ